LNQRWTYLKDKPYDFVPLISSVKKTHYKGSHSEFSKKMYSGRLKLNIVVKTPMHIGSGLYGKCNGGIAKLSMRRDNKLIIPGSALKGVIRSICESVSQSCVPELPFINKKVRNSKSLSDALPTVDIYKCNSIEKLCITCNMFGMAEENVSFKSKVNFGEFNTENGKVQFNKIRQLQSPFRDYEYAYRDIFGRGTRGMGNERIYYCQLCESDFNKGINKNCYTCSKDEYHTRRKKASNNRKIKFRGRKFYYHNKRFKTENSGNIFENYEFVRPGTIFSGIVTFENLNNDELRLLSFSLGLDNSFSHKIGYGKPLYMGSVNIKLDSVEDYFERFDEFNDRAYKIDKEKILTMAKDYYEICNNNEIRDSIDMLRKIMDFEKSSGPSWNGGY
jgi:CRISPR/Cas system CSM-associated protein Csm3 (group 7 of RAMP superfamily)